MAKGKRKTTVDPNETKADKFKRLATIRVNKVLAGLAGLAKLTTSSYEFTAEDVTKIQGVIAEHTEVAIKRLNDKLSGTKASTKPTFTL